MDNTQWFRWNGEPDIRGIDCDQVHGQNVVYWDDIQQFFPGVRYVMNDKSLVKIMKDWSGKRLDPPRIKHCPGTVLDVHLSTTDVHGCIEDLAAISRLPPASTATCVESVAGLAISEAPSAGLSLTEPRATTHVQRQLTAAMERATESGHPLDAAAILKLIKPKLVSPTGVSTTSALGDDSHFRDYMMTKVDELALTADEIKNMIVEVLQNQQLMMDYNEIGDEGLQATFRIRPTPTLYKGQREYIPESVIDAWVMHLNENFETVSDPK
ncbi:unnamed protein product [Mortierella alpina]